MRMLAALRAARVGVALASLSVAVAPPAHAHHAWNEIDTAKSFKLSGTVKSLKWENPHASLVLDVTGGEHRGQWTVLMSGIARMEAHDVRADTVAVGKSLVLVVSPMRGDPRTVRANTITSDGADHVLY